MKEERKKFYLESEIVELVRSLDRPEDNGLFSQDVVLQYPHLAEDYMRICPRRCDLATAARRAASGDYSYDVKLAALQDDIELMVNNCLRFNGPQGEYAAAATRFEEFAKAQLDAFVARKTDGRRVSSLRVATAAAESTRGKRQRDDLAPRPKKGGSQSTADATVNTNINANANTTVSIEAVVKLVQSMNRREDQGAFAVDVVKAYPEIKELYELVCPVKMDLTIMRKRAEAGYYHGPQQPPTTPKSETSSKRRKLPEVELAPSSVFGSTVAESMELLRSDVELIVSNCIKFNAEAEPWVQRAKSFQKHAHKLIDDFVIRHAPSLKGSRTGVAAYVTEHEQSQQKSQTARVSSSQDSQGIDGVTAGTAYLPLTVSSTTTTEKREETSSRMTPPTRPPTATVVNCVTPTVVPTPLQPVFKTPNVLRYRLISDHLHRETLRARLIYPNANSNNKDDHNDDAFNGNDDKVSSTQQKYDSTLSCSAVLVAFEDSVRHFYKSQRERQDFVNAFEHSRQEEQLYIYVINIVKQLFESLFLHTLLYDGERADVNEWTAEKAIRSMSKNNGTISLNGGDAKYDTSYNTSNSSWLDDAHLCYLVRLLQHFPQMMGLACAKPSQSSEAESTSTEQLVLHITKVEKGMIDKMAKITEEMLEFVAEYEQKAISMEGHEEGRGELQL